MRFFSGAKRTTLLLFATIAALGAVGGMALADIPPPKRQAAEPIYTDFEVRIDANAESTRLYIPRQTLSVSERIGQNQGGVRTLVAGLALTSALVIGGVVFMRRNGTATKAGIAALVVGAVMGVGGTLLADVALPAKPRIAASVGKYVNRTGLEIIVTDDGEAIVLVLGSEYSRRVQGGPDPKPGRRVVPPPSENE